MDVWRPTFDPQTLLQLAYHPTLNRVRLIFASCRDLLFGLSELDELLMAG